MKLLLDTNICIYIIKQKPPSVLESFRAYEPTAIGISSITAAELMYGVEKSSRVKQNRQALEQFLLPLVVIPFDAPAAQMYGRVRAHLERQATPIGPLDTLIAAHALSRDLTLVTNNEQEFIRIPDLQVENWSV